MDSYHQLPGNDQHPARRGRRGARWYASAGAALPAGGEPVLVAGPVVSGAHQIRLAVIRPVVSSPGRPPARHRG